MFVGVDRWGRLPAELQPPTTALNAAIPAAAMSAAILRCRWSRKHANLYEPSGRSRPRKLLAGRHPGAYRIELGLVEHVPVGKPAPFRVRNMSQQPL